MKKIKKYPPSSTASKSKTKKLQLILRPSEWHPLLILSLMLLLAVLLPFLFFAASALGKRWADSVNARELSNPCNETFEITHSYGNSSAPLTLFGEWHTHKEAKNVISCLNKLHPTPKKLSLLLEGPSPGAGREHACGKLRPEYRALDSMDVKCFSMEGPATPDSRERDKLSALIAFSALDTGHPEMIRMRAKEEEIIQARFSYIDQGITDVIERLRRESPASPIVAVVGINHANPNHSPRLFKTEGMSVFSTKTPDPQQARPIASSNAVGL